MFLCLLSLGFISPFFIAERLVLKILNRPNSMFILLLFFACFCCILLVILATALNLLQLHKVQLKELIQLINLFHLILLRFKYSFQISSSVAICYFANFFWSPFCDNFSATISTFWPHIDNIICNFDNI